jgi:glycerol-3-phosphate acyltransferase PlsY
LTVSTAPWLDLARTLLALLAGYLVGSLPVSMWVGRAAGVNAAVEGDANPGSANVWQLAGPGWGMLALAGDLAKGMLPVAIAVVTFSWWTGWVAGVGVVAGAGWPALGRLPGGRGVAATAGVCLGLAPVAGGLAALLALVVAMAARLAGRNGRVAAIATGFAAFPVLFLVEELDLARLAGLGLLYLAAVARYAVTRR